MKVVSGKPIGATDEELRALIEFHRKKQVEARDENAYEVAIYHRDRAEALGKVAKS